MNKLTGSIDQYAFTLLLPDGAPNGLICLPMHGSAEDIWNLLPQKTSALLAIGGFDWNRDLSPWPAEAVFPDETDFGGQADAFLDRLTDEIIPLAEREAGLTPAWRGVAGYSLAGLFAVYAACRCSAFSRIASVSGSMWYNGWMEYARSTPFAGNVTRAYFSVGAREKRTRNTRMSTVEQNTREMCELTSSRGVESRFDLNPGNHFVDVERRMAAAIAFLSR